MSPSPDKDPVDRLLDTPIGRALTDPHEGRLRAYKALVSRA